MTNYEHIIIVEDFSGTVNCEIDRSTSNKKKKKTNNGRFWGSFFKLMENKGLVDVRRKRNQGNRDYTFYSDRHKVWSRINLVWVSKELDFLTNKVEILPRVISNHSPVIWRMREDTQSFKI